jgi:MFS family permease
VRPGGALRPLQESRFRRLWLARVSSGAGDALVPVALAFAVLSIASPAAFGFTLAAFWIPRVAFTLAGGVVADRLPRRAVMLACDGARAVVEAFTAVMLLTHQMTLPLFIVTAALFGTASAFFGPASDGLIPQTVGTANLQAANALLGTSRNLLNVFGPAVSGLLIAAAGTGWVFALDSASFVVSAYFLLRLNVGAHDRAPRSHFMLEVREGWREVTARSWVSIPIAGFAIFNFCFAAFLVLGPAVFREHLSGARGWGVVSACGAAGAILGTILSGQLRPRHPISVGFLGSVLVALPIAALARPFPTAAIAAAWFLGMGSIAVCNTYWETNLQQRIPSHVFSRVRSYDILVSFVFMPLGFVVFPQIARAIGREETLLLAAGIVAVTNVVVAFTPGVRAVTRETLESGSPAANQVRSEAA